MIRAKVAGSNLRVLRAAHITRFDIHGHAASGAAGHDLVCAGVSALAANFVNSVELLTDRDPEPTVGDGLLKVAVTEDDVTQCLARSLLCGLTEMAKEYGKYLVIVLEEDPT